MDYKYKLGRNIKAERIRKSITQEKFAELVDISVSHASKIEQGLTSPTAMVLYKMAKILEIPMEDFLRVLTWKNNYIFLQNFILKRFWKSVKFVYIN
mgnify:CR=1 FL=1